MKSFGQMTTEEMMKVLLYGELRGEKAVVDPRIRAGSLMRLIGAAREELRKAQAVVDDANPKGHNWEVYKDPAGAKRSATEIYKEWTGIRDMWRKLIEDAEKAILAMPPRVLGYGGPPCYPVEAEDAYGSAGMP